VQLAFSTLNTKTNATQLTTRGTGFFIRPHCFDTAEPRTVPSVLLTSKLASSFGSSGLLIASGCGFGAPAPRAALEHMTVMQQPIEHRTHCGNIA
jgi:hypothetical protein